MCGDCGFKVAQGADNICSIFRIIIDAEKDSCPKYKPVSQMKHCEICGKALLEPGIIDLKDGHPHLICSNCLNSIETCMTCQEILDCDFETNPSPTEKTITKQIRQGNMISVTTVKNPKRIEETCKKNCKCFDEKNGCLRQTIRTCEHWHTTY